MVAVNRVETSTPAFSPDLAREFEGILRDIQQKFSAAGVPGGLNNQAQGFITTADQNNDNKVNAAELGAVLNLDPQRAEQFIGAFNSTGDQDAALDATELAKAVAAVEEPGEPSDAVDSPQESEGHGAGAGTGGESSHGASGSSQGGGTDHLSMLMKLIDTNGDGQISPDELKEFLEKHDKNQDGKLDKTELAEALNAGAQECRIPQADIESLLSKADADKDGGLNAEELGSAFEAGMEGDIAKDG